MFWSLLAASGGTPCYYDQGLWWWQQGGPGAGYCQCHHHCQGVITEHSSGCISAANIIIFLLQHNEERNVITFYWHCALFLISQYGEDERSPGPGKCSVRILWHLLTFIPRAPVSDQLSSASGPVMASLNHPVISRQMFGWSWPGILISLWWRAIILFLCDGVLI